MDWLFIKGLELFDIQMRKIMILLAKYLFSIVHQEYVGFAILDLFGFKKTIPENVYQAMNVHFMGNL